MSISLTHCQPHRFGMRRMPQLVAKLIMCMNEWWSSVNTIGPSYGYHANPSKTWLIVKEEYLSSAKEFFAPAGVNITTDGKHHLGAAVGTGYSVECYVQCKVSQCIDNVKRLSDIAHTQPHAAYSAFTCGLSCQWSCLSRTIPHTT